MPGRVDVFAETVSLDAGALLLGLLVILIVVGIFVAGFLCAPVAGRGSRLALAVWIVALVVEGLASVGAVLTAVDGHFSLALLIPPTAVGVQAAMFVQARAARPPG
jgi:hypothetical protein